MFDPVGLFLPQPAKAKTKQRKTADKIRVKIFFIFILYILSCNNSKITVQKKFFLFPLFVCMDFFWSFEE